jgi:hypothetical protein
MGASLFAPVGTYYSAEHVETVLKRVFATGRSPGKTLFYLSWFKGCIAIEKVHPLEGGWLRRKFRRNRRCGTQIESAWLFYPKYLWESTKKQVQWIKLYVRLRAIYRRIKRDPRRDEYIDLALMPVTDRETDTRAMFQSKAAQEYVASLRRLEKIRAGEQM